MFQTGLNNISKIHLFFQALELTDHIQDFIDSCLPQLRSQWPEVRGSAAIVIGKCSGGPQESLK